MNLCLSHLYVCLLIHSYVSMCLFMPLLVNLNVIVYLTYFLQSLSFWSHSHTSDHYSVVQLTILFLNNICFKIYFVTVPKFSKHILLDMFLLVLSFFMASVSKKWEHKFNLIAMILQFITVPKFIKYILLDMFLLVLLFLWLLFQKSENTNSI
jgi:hypothetical protein